MSLALSDIILGARDRHPAFHKSRVTDAVVARFLTRYQRRLITRAADIDASLVAQQASIMFAAVPENAVGVAGAGTTGGFPGALTTAVPPAPVAVKQDAGALIDIDTDNPTVLAAEAVVTSATATTLTRTGAAWVVNAYTGKYVVITAGTGAGQRREIASNTADTLTLKAGQTFATTPDATSIFEIIAATLSQSKQAAAVLELPPTGTRQAYLVKLDANGVPFLDLGAPLLAKFDQGISLPPHTAIIGGTVRFRSGGYPGMPTALTGDLHIRPYRGRTLWEPHTVWIEGGKLFLAGTLADWRDVDSVDLRYIPIAPAFAALADLFLLPDTAYDTLVASAAAFCGSRVKALPDAPDVDTKELNDEASECEGAWLSGIGIHGRGHVTYVKETW